MTGVLIRLLASAIVLIAPFLAFGQTPPVPATADRPVFAVQAGAGINWDSNIFLLSNSADAQAQLGTSNKSDTVTSAFAGISIDKHYSLQHFYLDATETAYHHANFSYLNFNAFQYRGGWDWHLTPRISGTITADRTQQLVNYSNYQNTSELNVVTAEHRRALLDGWVSGGWHVLLSGLQNVSNNSQTFTQQTSYREYGADGGIKYLAESGSAVELHAASVRGTYPDQQLDPVNLLDDGYRRNDSYALATWQLGAKSTVDGRLGWVDYRSNNFAQRDFSGTAGTLGYRWRPTDKLSLGLTAARNLWAYVTNTSSYVVVDTVSFVPTWQMSAKTALSVTVSQTSSDYRGPVVANPGPLRHDDLTSAQVGLSWTPLRSVTVGASLRHQHNGSNTAGYDYDDNSASVNASVLF
jgi:exopolysaccharide biosynthesis operon protein EpsL